ncbi:hypothetical protein HDU98_003767 [Podochytrium sp. JEL0797]|nr:hypothetical protein HDU98_003767 [Podochytrium sp. JEL0797]
MYFMGLLLLTVLLFNTLGVPEDASERFVKLSNFYTTNNNPYNKGSPPSNAWNYEYNEFDEKPEVVIPTAVPNDTTIGDFDISALHAVTTKNWATARAKAVLSFWNKATAVSVPDAAKLSSRQVMNLFPATGACDWSDLKTVGIVQESSHFVCSEYLDLEGECNIFLVGLRRSDKPELDLLLQTERKCKIHVFCHDDHTPIDPLVQFHPWCLGSEDEDLGGKSFKTWATTLRVLGVQTVTYVKLGLENGLEWIILPEIMKSGNTLPRQITVELHRTERPHGVLNNFANIRTASSVDTLHSYLSMMTRIYSLGYQTMMRKSWSSSDIFTFVLNPSATVDVVSWPETFSKVGSVAVQTSQSTPQVSTENGVVMDKILASHDWNAVRSREAQDFWFQVEQLSIDDAATLTPHAWDLFPVTFSCDRNSLKSVGGLPNGDGSYSVCSELVSISNDCTFISIGGRGLYSWEEEMIKTFPGCKAHTFDCTGDWPSGNPDILFHQWCLGKDEVIDGRVYKSWETTVKELGISHVDFLKCDIEGWEWVVVPQILNMNFILPTQLAIEIHQGFQPPTATPAEFQPQETIHGNDHVHPLLNLFRLIYAAGYHTASKKDWFSEFEIYTFVLDTRVRDLAYMLPTRGVEVMSEGDEVANLHLVATKDWNVERAQYALNLWEVLGQAEAGNVEVEVVHSLVPETYACDENYLRLVDGNWICAEFLQAPACQQDGTVEGFWSCHEFFTPMDNCHVFSVGFQGTWDWEVDMLALTKDKCKIHVFECETDGQHASKLSPPNRLIQFHNWCIGKDATVADGKVFKSWSSILSDVGVGRVDFLRINTGGSEWSLLPHLLKNVNTLPRQMLVQLYADDKQGADHLHPTLNLMKSLYAAGYKTALKQTQPESIAYTFVLPPIPHGKTSISSIHSQHAPPSNHLLSMIQTKNWAKDFSLQSQNFWSLASTLPPTFADRVSNRQVFNAFPVTHECDGRYLKSVGGAPREDGTYWTCLDRIDVSTGCNLMSVGGNGMWGWELDMISQTQGKCRIHTLDCTGDWEPPSPLITFHKWCLGGKDEVVDGKEFKTWNSVVSELKLQRLDYFKIDIEGWEWVVMPQILNQASTSLRTGSKNRRISSATTPRILPAQIAIELHLGWQPPNATTAEYSPANKDDHLHPMIRMFEMFDRNGYKVASKKMWNYPGELCQIFTFVL